MGCGCHHHDLTDGKAIVDHVKRKGKENEKPLVFHKISCECGTTFTFEKVVMNCPNCGMTYGVTPCSSDKIENIRAAGIRYA